MKFKIKLNPVFFILFSLFTFQESFSQCPTIDYALINSCASGSTEGVNEFIVFTTSANAAAGNYQLYYDNDSNVVNSPLNILSGVNARTKNGTGTISANSCSSSLNFVTSPTTIIPSGSKVVFIPSNFEQDYDFSLLCSGVGIYIVYIDITSSSPSPNWNGGGTFGNTPNSNRYIQITNGSNNCASNIRIFDFGWASDKDGNFVSWNNTGDPSYGNNGCNFNSIPPTINPESVGEICFGATTTTMSYTVTENPNKYSITWNATALSSGFTNVVDGDLTTSPLSIAVSSSANPGTYTASLLVTNTTSGLSSSTQNISVKINPTPTLTVTPNNRCGDGVVNLLATSSGTLNWYNGSVGGVSIKTGSSFITPSISTTTTYWVDSTIGSCTSSRTAVTATVNSNVITTFNSIATLCQGETAPILPTSSTNVPPVIGTWNTTINTSALGTTNYTFTPNTGQCASTATLPVTVDNCGFGTFASAAWLSNCNVPNGQFYNITGSGVDLINPTSPAGSFITNLGSFIQNSGSLTFGGGEIKTFKSSIGNVCGATMFYNIHPQGVAAGTFTPLTLNFFSDCNSGSFTGGGPCSPRDQKWQTVTGGLVDMTALPPGNYVLEVYYTVNGDNNSSSQCDDTTILNNAGANYLSTFSIQGTPNYSSTNPLTCSGTEGTITISGLLANTNYTLSYKDDEAVVGPSSVTSNSSGSIVISGLNAGTYSNFIVGADCGNYTNNSPIVLVNPTLSTSISKVDNSVCQSASVPCNGSATVVPSGSGSYSYLWDDALGQTSATATALCLGTYSVTITDLVSLCTLSRSITVGNTAVLPVLSSLNPVATPICSGGNAVFTLSGSGNASVTYSINGEAPQIVNLDASGSASVSVNQASSDTTLVLSQISLGSCSAALTNTATVIVSSPPNAGILNGLQTVCVNGVTTFSSTVNGGSWSSLDSSIATVDAFGVVTGVSNGTATINYTVLGTGGCTNSAIASRAVTVSSSSVTITAGCIDINYTLVASTSEGNSTFKWYKGDTLLDEISNTLIVTKADTYKVVVANGDCLSETTENVTFLYCDIPRGISPNNDQKNDFFDLTNFQVNKLEIFNRYGMKVYSKSNYKKEWDGKSDSGQELPDATYYYVVEFKSGKSKTGWVYINRQQ